MRRVEDLESVSHIGNTPLPKTYEFYSGSFSLAPITITTGMQAPGIVLPDFITLSGYVTDSNGVGIPNVDVSGFCSETDESIPSQLTDSWNRTTSGSDGYYELALLPGLVSDLSISPPDASGFSGVYMGEFTLTTSILQNVILNIPDTTPPLILSGPMVVSVTDTSAVIEWVTDELASGGVDYGLSESLGSTVNEVSFTTLHAQELSGLTPDTLYYAQVFASDVSGNGPTVSGLVSFRTNALADTTAPVILEGPTVRSITHNSAVVEWLTNEPADSTVNYGTSDALGTVVSDASDVTLHSITLTSLSADTQYFLNVQSTDTAGNGPTTSHIVDFYTLATPDILPPVIIGAPMAINITDTEATIVWTTDEPSTSGVSYNDGTAYGVAQDDALVTEHAVHLTGLTADTLYHFTVASTDAHGNGPTLSAEHDFTTLSLTDTEPPVILDGSLIVNITHQSAVIRWRTNESSDSLVEFGLTAALGESTGSASLVYNHNITLTGLLASTEYFYRVSSVDGVGNGPTVSAIMSFTTDPDGGAGSLAFTVMPHVVAQTDTTTTLEWATDAPSDALVTYGTATPLNLSRSEGERTLGHQMTLTNLTPDATYSFEITATDIEGNYVSTDTSFVRSGHVFLTDIVADTTAPVLTVAPEWEVLSDTTAVVRWSTDEVSDSRVVYGALGSSMINFAGDPALVTVHEVYLTNLTPGVEYVYVVASADVSGNLYLSAEATLDSDGDGLSDLTESIFGTNPGLADSDGDGYSDFEEVLFGTDPLDVNDFPAGELPSWLIYLEFGVGGLELGTIDSPWSALSGAYTQVASSGTIRIITNGGTVTTSETGILNKPLRLESTGGGIVRLGE